MAGMSSTERKAAASPCVGTCRLRGNVCAGCGRTTEEVAGWTLMTDGEKVAVKASAAARLADGRSEAA